MGDHRYTLTFGGFLLLGTNRDYMGRKKSFLIGLLGFAGASLLEASPESTVALRRVRCRALRALLAPAALSLISVTFTDSKERAKLRVYGDSPGRRCDCLIAGVC